VNHLILIALAIFGLLLSSCVHTTSGDANENNIINDLIKTGKFTEDEAKEFIRKTMPNGQQDDNNNQTGSKVLSDTSARDGFNVDTKLLRYDTIFINGTIKQGTFFSTNYYLQHNVRFTFGNTNPLCPNNCKYKFEDGDFSDSLFGENDKVLSGVLKIEDKENSEGNFTSYINYKMSGVMHLIKTKENRETGEQIDIYKGDLGFDTEDAVFAPKYEYASTSTYDHSSGLFELKGISKN
jgi:hypothetical protein